MCNVFARSVYLCRLLSVDLYCFLLFGCLGTMICFDEFGSVEKRWGNFLS